MIDLLYKFLAQPALFMMDAETAHQRTLALFGPRPWLLPNYRPPSSDVRDVGGVQWAGPVGLAAGMDKGGHALMLWERLGFGAVELGTVTPKPQVGNPRPRIHRLVKHGAIVNKMGFPGEGAIVVQNRLAAMQAANRWPSIPVGINIGKNAATLERDAHLDYQAAATMLREFADYLVVNVSSPNTPGLRALQAADPLRRILNVVLEVSRAKPVFVKFGPDMSDDELRGAVQAAGEEGVTGIIATNTTNQRPVETDKQGGLSGEPLYPIARNRIQLVLDETTLPVIGVGGFSEPFQVAEALAAGCSAVQLYTGLIYKGPTLPSKLNEAVRGSNREAPAQ